MNISKIWGYLWEEWVKPIIVAAILALIIRTFIIQPFKIPSSSMYPTLKPGDRIFVSKFIYGAKIPFTDLRLPALRKPRLGDIVVFLSPIEKKKYLIKRFIAGAGDTVQIKDRQLYVNGKKIGRPPFSNITYFNRGKFEDPNTVITVPPDSFFVLGDNSANSLDSRYWGFAPDDNLVGRAVLIHWPPSRIRIFRAGD